MNIGVTNFLRFISIQIVFSFNINRKNIAFFQLFVAVFLICAWHLAQFYYQINMGKIFTIKLGVHHWLKRTKYFS